MEKTRDKLSRMSVDYLDQPFLRALINTIPNIGGALDVLLSASGQRYIQQRIESFINELSEQVSSIDESKMNIGFLETEEGFDLMIKAFNSAARTRQQEKRRLFARVIKSTLTAGKKYNEEAPELYLKIIDELSVKELRVGKLIFELKANLPMHEAAHITDVAVLSRKYPEFSKEELTYILVRLEKTGLIKLIMIVTHGSGHDAYQITQLFVEFMTFLDEQNK